MKKNEKAILEIIDYSTDGFGIAKADDGMTVFIPNGAVGDIAEVLIVKELKKFCFGKIIDIKTPSKNRIENNCEAFLRCGGCSFNHINYDSELLFKQKRVQDAITRIGKIDIGVEECLSNNVLSRYRNKGQYPVRADNNGFVTAGFYSLHSHRVIPCEDCILQPTEFSKIVLECIGFFNDKKISAYDEQTGKGLVRHIYLRKSETENKVLVCLVLNGENLPYCDEFVDIIKQYKFVSGIVFNINTQKTNVILGKKNKIIYGDGFLVDNLLGIDFKISPNAFFQVNRKMTEILYKTAADFAKVDDKVVLDLFCGAGTIGLTMAKRAKKVIGVEIVPQAVENAKENAKINKINNAEFICDTAENAAEKLAKKGEKADVVILDPPRKGATYNLIDTICNKFSPKTVVYVSCDPATLARDLMIFEQFNYKTKKVKPIDLFPRTPHIETVVLLNRE